MSRRDAAQGTCTTYYIFCPCHRGLFALQADSLSIRQLLLTKENNVAIEAQPRFSLNYRRHFSQALGTDNPPTTRPSIALSVLVCALCSIAHGPCPFETRPQMRDLRPACSLRMRRRLGAIYRSCGCNRSGMSPCTLVHFVKGAAGVCCGGPGRDSVFLSRWTSNYILASASLCACLMARK